MREMGEKEREREFDMVKTYVNVITNLVKE